MSTNIRHRFLLRAALAGTAGLGALASLPTLLAASPKLLHVVVENIAFGPTPADARVGDTVEWSNKDFVAHTATARDGSFDLDLPAGKSGRVVLTHAGEIAFYCRYHPTMTGQLAVSP